MKMLNSHTSESYKNCQIKWGENMINHTTTQESYRTNDLRESCIRKVKWDKQTNE
jgi:hypothetical protein